MPILNMISRRKILLLDSTRSTGFSAVKLTALGRPNLLVSRQQRRDHQDIGRGKIWEFEIHQRPKFLKSTTRIHLIPHPLLKSIRAHNPLIHAT